MKCHVKRYVLTLGVICGAAALAADAPVPVPPPAPAPPAVVQQQPAAGPVQDAKTGVAEKSVAATADVKAPTVAPVPVPVPDNPRLRQMRARQEYVQLNQQINAKETKLKEENPALRKALDDIASQIQALHAESRKRIQDADPGLKSLYEKREAAETELKSFVASPLRPPSAAGRPSVAAPAPAAPIMHKAPTPTPDK